MFSTVVCKASVLDVILVGIVSILSTVVSFMNVNQLQKYSIKNKTLYSSTQKLNNYILTVECLCATATLCYSKHHECKNKVIRNFALIPPHITMTTLDWL